MPFYSPLRYPGGKNKLAKYIALLCEENNIHGHYVEPYAGGASVALHLLLNEYVSEVTINDLDRSVYAFWNSTLNQTDELCALIRKTKISVSNWRKCKDIQSNKQKASLLELGFSTFFLNRTNFSGVLNGGVIGGLKQTGKYKIGCRFNKNELIKRIRKIAEYKDSISLHNSDAADLILDFKKLPYDRQTIFYFDPPYYLKGKSLYINYYKHADHEKVSSLIQGMHNARWVVSYDNTEAIRKMYQGCEKREYSFLHTAHRAKEGHEILFFAKNLIIPKVPSPVKV